MNPRKIAALMVVFALAVMVAQPALAGVGGCRGRDCLSASPEMKTPRGLSIVKIMEIAADALSPLARPVLKGILNPTPQPIPQEPKEDIFEGLGCRKGVGGC
jgi:hypothetical protein